MKGKTGGRSEKGFSVRVSGGNGLGSRPVHAGWDPFFQMEDKKSVHPERHRIGTVMAQNWNRNGTEPGRSRPEGMEKRGKRDVQQGADRHELYRPREAGRGVLEGREYF